MARKHGLQKSRKLERESASGTAALVEPSSTKTQPNSIHYLQRTIGNHATRQLLAGGGQSAPSIQRAGLWDTLSDMWKQATSTTASETDTSSSDNVSLPDEPSTEQPPSPSATDDIRVVTDGDARIRTAPPELANTGFTFIKGNSVRILETVTHKKKTYVHAEEVLADGIEASPVSGWTVASNLKGGTAAPSGTEDSETTGGSASVKATPGQILSPDDIPGLPPMPNIQSGAFTEIVSALQTLEQNPLKIETKHNEEIGEPRDERVREIARLRGLIKALTAGTLGVSESEVLQAQAYLYRRLAPQAPYANQMANTNMLEQFVVEEIKDENGDPIKDENGKKKYEAVKDKDGNYVMKPGWERTCNVTVPAMVVEGVGKTRDDYEGNVELLKKIFNALEGKYKTRLNYKAESDFDNLRLADFMTLVAISFNLPKSAAQLEGTAFAEAVAAARQEAANRTTLHEVMMKLITSFDAEKEKHEFHKSDLDKIGGKRRAYVWKQLRGGKITKADQKQYDSVKEDNMVSVETYRDGIRELVNPMLDSGAQVLVGMEEHFVRLDAMSDEQLMVDDPGHKDFKNLLVTWAQARDLGFFKNFWKITG